MTEAYSGILIDFVLVIGKLEITEGLMYYRFGPYGDGHETIYAYKESDPTFISISRYTLNQGVLCNTN